MREALRRVGLWSFCAHEKRIHREVWAWSDASIAAFIAGYLVTYGSAYTGVDASAVVSFVSMDRPRLEDLRELLAVRFCVYGSAITRARRACTQSSGHDAWAMTITRIESVRRLYSFLAQPMAGVQKARFDTRVTGSEPARRVYYRCARKHTSRERSERCSDITVDHPDHLFVLANGAIVSNTKHSGGAASTKDPDSLSGFEIVRDLAMVPSTFPHRAAVATLDGKVEAVTEAAQGGYYVTVAGEPHYSLGTPQVKVGDTVEAGDVLGAGLVNPRDVVEHKGIGAGREYFVRRYTKALRDSGYEVNRRNVELLGRANINHVTSDAFDGDMLPGDVLQYNAWQSTYEPREDAVEVDPVNAVGKYLERPVMHYTIGTRVTRRMLPDLKEFAPDKKLLVSGKAPSFSAHMESLTQVPQYYPDWQAQLGANYLTRSLLRNAHRGASSDSAGLHPIPAVARGVGLSSSASPTKPGPESGLPRAPVSGNGA